MGLRPVEIFLLLQRGDWLKSSESDVYRRQILTNKVGPRAVWVNVSSTSGYKSITAGNNDTAATEFFFYLQIKL